MRQRTRGRLARPIAAGLLASIYKPMDSKLEVVLA
jgi:hypothetical protein